MEEEIESLNNMYEELHVKVAKWISADEASPLAVAAIMMTTALRLYRTTLNDSDFDQMMNYISDARNTIEKFPTPDEYKNKLN